MKRLILILFMLLGLAQSAIAASPEGDIKLGGINNTILAWKSSGGSCWVIDLRRIQATVPKVWTPAFEVLKSGMVTRTRTLEENELCYGVQAPPPPPEWGVHDNGNTSRPVYTMVDGMLVKHKSERASIGEYCGDFVVSVANSSKLEYRFLPTRKDKPNRLPGMIAVCEFK